MTRESDEEKAFLENIERLLAGQEAEAGENVSEDYSTAIHFAQKLIELRDEPSPRFKEQLRRRLLSKLALQEAEAAKQKRKRTPFWEALRNLIPQSAVWRSATATVVVALLAIVVLWGTGIFTQAPEQWAERGPEPAMAPPADGGPEGPPLVTLDSGAILKLEPTLAETSVYLVGEEIKIDLVFRNASSESIIVVPFPPAFQISQADTGEVVRSFAQGRESAEVSATGTLNYTLVWKQLDDSGKQVEPGRYLIIVSDVTIQKGIEPQEARLSFEFLTELTIKSP